MEIKEVRVTYLCEFNDTSQWDIPLMDSSAVKNDEISRGTVSDEKSPRGGRCVCQALAILLRRVLLEVYAQSAQPCDLRMKNTV